MFPHLRPRHPLLLGGGDRDEREEGRQGWEGGGGDRDGREEGEGGNNGESGGEYRRRGQRA